MTKLEKTENQPLFSQVDGEKIAGVAVVTGGSQRLGAAICRDLARLGYTVALTYHRSEAKAWALVEEIRAAGGRAAAFRLDLRDPVRLSSLLGEVERELGPVDLLVNNASLFLETQDSWELLNDLFCVNLQGPLWLSAKAAARMANRGGQIIFMCDIWGERPLRGYTAYCAAKAGLIMATQTLARDWAPGVRVNAIAPGAVLPPDDDLQCGSYRQMVAKTPLSGESGVEPVLQAIRYLLTARFVTGEILHVDGGRRLV